MPCPGTKGAMPARATQVLLTLVGLLTAVTIYWVFWGLVSAGDFFAQGRTFALVTLIGAALAGAIVGYKMKGTMPRIVLGAFGVASVVFWLAAPRGWWALPSPRPHEVQVRP